MSGSRLTTVVSCVVSCVAALALSAAAPHARQQAGFRAGTDAILLDVLVSRQGTAVEGLTAEDFTVLDSGVPQTVQLLSTGTLPVQLLLVFDTSASLRGEPLQHLKEAAKSAVNSLRPADEAALITFSHNLLPRAPWTTSRETLNKAIDSVLGQGLTSLNDAAFAALAMTAKPGTRRLVLFFTDGDDTSSWTSGPELLQMARRSDSVIYNVTLEGPGNSGAAMTKLLMSLPPADKTAELERRLAAEPGLYRSAVLPLLSIATGGESIPAADSARLAASFSQIVSRFSKRYILAYTPAGVPAGGWHPIDVQVKSGGDIVARRGYTR